MQPKLGCVISLLPVLSFLLLLVFGKRLGEKSSYIGIAAVALALLLSIKALVFVIGGGHEEVTFTWVKIGSFELTFGLLLDSLAATMLVIVTFVSLLVQVFSKGYMHGDKRIGWFYACLSMFTASMLALVFSPNYVQMYMAWEGVGVFSYLLIGFWFEKKIASDAAKKAFMVTRVGDLGFAVGLVLLYITAGTLDIDQVFAMKFAPAAASTISILLFFGAIGKSAQFPLHVWLPDAMEGPTPVSALIHAATMVAAGVFLVARSYPLFTQGPAAMEFVAIIGTITAFIAATIALTATDIKKILAYSTVSQLGYMMMGLGVGAFAAGTFHLMTHAFFKALLFLGAGSVIHAVHSQEIFEMGGLLKKMKITGTTFIIGGLVLAGVPPLAGFWSKDEILLGAYNSDISGHMIIFVIGLLTALITAFYTFRLIFIVFFGKPRSKKVNHAHESPMVMSIPLILLGTLAAVAGFVGSPLTHNAFQEFVNHSFMVQVHAEHEANMVVMGLSILVALLGITIAWLKYVKNILPSGVISKDNFFYKLLVNKYYFDEMYYKALIAPTHALAKAVQIFDQRVIDGAVNGVAWLTIKLGSNLRVIQTGYLRNYALYMVTGLIILIIWSFRVLGLI
ncbi:MAG: NADH-quinone oxidoreductase subunit L [Rubrobacteridae bacterium]|nr:NADH-quinone oxidoreductase subunit L [Rubrobacteridae bacterium]